jgi:hypothetical protein
MNPLRPAWRDQFLLGALALGALVPPVALLAWNGFPFVYWDTSEYLYRWAEGRPGFDRPIFYSLWLAAFHPLPYGLYAAALAQVAVSILLIICICRRIGPRPLRRTTLFLLCLSLSPTVFHSVTLMPDSATSWLVFSLAMFTLNGRPTPKLAVGAAITAILFHNSHFLLFLGLAPVVLVVGTLNRRPIARLGGELLLILLLSLAGISWNSWLAGLGFRPFAPISPFLAARLQEARLLAPGLRELAKTRVTPLLRVGYETLADRLEAGPASLDWFAWDAGSPLNEQWPGWPTS